MNSSTAYLENEIRTATPQKLRRMLIEGGIRFAYSAKIHLQANENSLAEAAKARCRAILAELLDSIEGEHEVAVQMRSVYAILLTSYIAQDAIDPIAAIDSLLQGLKEELQTWSQICEMHPQLPAEVTAARARNRELTSAEAAMILEQSDQGHPSGDHPSRGESFCLDA